MSFFELTMLLCFGLAWPFSIYKSYATRENGSKSLIFLFVALAGYIAGIFHKLIYNPDMVTYLYIVNSGMVSIDIILYFRNTRLGSRRI